MVVGYVAKWITLLEAIQHVQRVLGDTLKDARDKLLVALREGAVTARYHGKDIGGIAAHYEGTGGGVPPARWYKVAAVNDDGSVEFTDNPNFPLPRPIRLREHIEVQRSDLERWWPTPPRGETEASTTHPTAETISLIEAAPIEAQPSSKLSRIHIPTKREAVAAWLAERYPEGIPVGVVAKKIARDFEDDKKISVDVRTVRRALGRH